MNASRLKKRAEIEEQLEKIKKAISYYDKCGWSKKYHYALRGQRALEWVLGIGFPPTDDLPCFGT